MVGDGNIYIVYLSSGNTMPSNNIDKKEFNLFYDVFKIMNGKDLVEEFHAHNASKENSIEYKALKTVLNEKYKLSNTDLKSLEFAEYLDRKKVNVFSASVNYLTGVMKKIFGYTSLKGNKRGIEKDNQMRSFSKKNYEYGKSLADKLK